MGCAPMSYVLFRDFANVNPKDPKWSNRDRFVLSAGHGSMLQYSLLHLLGFNLSIDDLKEFRQLHSRTPGHPENFVTEGIEVTTGPLGAGFANAVGLAVAERHLAGRFNKDGEKPLIDHYTYCIMGDGCNMEGISNEAASLAGHWKLGKLIVFYDDNHISIDGNTNIAFTEDVLARYEALGWHTQHVADGNTDLAGMHAAVEAAKAVTDRPSIIKITTLIGYGSPNKANTHSVHGSPLGDGEAKATRDALHWPYAPFEVPEEAYAEFAEAAKRGAAKQKEWEAVRAAYAEKHPDDYEEWEAIELGTLPRDLATILPQPKSEDKGLATRLHSQANLNALAPALPGLLGGSADLAGSCMTLLKGLPDFQDATPEGRNFRFGVREHAMGGIANGLALHSRGLVPYAATFFVFTDYMRSPIRMSALEEAGVLWVMTHDSIGLGEDGPTHQPIEQLASFRAMPNIIVLRPGDGTETAGAYKVAVENALGHNPSGKPRPSLLVFSRQGMPNLDTSSLEGVAHGAYIAVGSEQETPDVILLATGTELQIAVAAAAKLSAEGIKPRVVSVPSWELFFEQEQSYRDSILPPQIGARVSIEAGSTFGWERLVGAKGRALGVDTFGASAPAPQLYEMFGLTVDNLAAVAKEVISQQ